MLYWFLKMVLLGPVLRVLFRPWVEGEENVPRHGGAILASNHLSFSDSIFLPLVLHRRITFPAKMEYFTAPGVTGRLKALFFRGTGQIPIDRRGGSASQAALDAGLAVLRRGELFGIYPEGTRSPDGRLYRGKTGVARMALEAGVPIIPVAMIDTDKAQPTGQKIPNITRVGVRFGRPIDLSRYADRPDAASDHEVLREITDEVMAQLARLSGRPYVDEYAATRKEVLAARAEEMLRAARAETAAAAAKGQELLATARVESAAKAQQILETARTESAAAGVRAQQMFETARTESVAAGARAEELLNQARVQSTARAESLVEATRARLRKGDGAPAEGEAEDVDVNVDADVNMDADVAAGADADAQVPDGEANIAAAQANSAAGAPAQASEPTLQNDAEAQAEAPQERPAGAR